MTTGTHSFWLEHFSTEGRWQENINQDDISKVLRQTPDKDIEAISKELAVNIGEVDSTALTNLLRHWMRLSLDERSTLKNPDHAKSLRSKAKRLTKALTILDELLGSHHRSGLSYPISQHLDTKFPVHRADYLLNTLRDISRELRPATETLAQEKLGRGPKGNDTAIAEIDGLADIFEYLTETNASRTFDAISNSETGSFHAFVGCCLRMLNEGEDAPIDWAFRQALEDRAKRRKAFSQASET